MYCVFKKILNPHDFYTVEGTVPAGNKKFSTYEQARQYARKLIRKNEPMRNFWWTSNPMIGDYGYTIRKLKNG